MGENRQEILSYQPAWQGEASIVSCGDEKQLYYDAACQGRMLGTLGLELGALTVFISTIFN